MGKSGVSRSFEGGERRLCLPCTCGEGLGVFPQRLLKTIILDDIKLAIE